jgi:hypothetical protein
MKKKNIVYPTCYGCKETWQPVRFVLRDTMGDDSEREYRFCSSSCTAKYLADEAGCTHSHNCHCYDNEYSY